MNFNFNYSVSKPEPKSETTQIISDNIDKYKEYYKLTLENYKEIDDSYNNLIEKASKLLPFLTIISAAILFGAKWLIDNFTFLKQNIIILGLPLLALLIFSIIELILIFNVLIINRLSKVIIENADEDYFAGNEEEAVYFGLAKRYSNTNAINFEILEKKSLKLGTAQKGLIYLMYSIIGVTIFEVVFLITKY